MHADLVKLLDLQSKDGVVGEIERRMEALRTETAALDQALERAREGRDAAHRVAAEGARRRDELEAKIESYRVLQERRQLRLEHVRNPKEASTLMAELDLARSVLAKEENRLDAKRRERDASSRRRRRKRDRGYAAFEESQTPERSRLAKRQAELDAEQARPQRAIGNRAPRSSIGRFGPDTTACGSRVPADVVVPLVGGACGCLPHLDAAQPPDSDPHRRGAGQL